MRPVRLHQQQPAAWFQRARGCREDQFRPLAVMERVVEQASVEATPEVELLVVAGLEGDLEPFPRGLLAGDLDHLRRDVVALGLDAVPCGEPRHPTRAAAELDQARADVQVEQLQDVAEVHQQAPGRPRIAPERLDADPLAADLADRVRVVDLRLLAPVLLGHGGEDKSRGASRVSCGCTTGARDTAPEAAKRRKSLDPAPRVVYSY